MPYGVVDERSIADVQPEDLVGFRQCHFFAGIGGWSLAARLAGWDDGRELWTGSCPCQPFSVAGKQAGTDDPRHLWPHYLRLIAARRPAAVMGEQVAAAVGKDWLDGVSADLEGIGYSCGAAVVPACAVDAPHRRDRVWFVASRDVALDHGVREGLEGLAGNDGAAEGRPVSDRPASAPGCGGHVAHANVVGACEGREQRGGELRRTCGDPRPCDCDLAYADVFGPQPRDDDPPAGYRAPASADRGFGAWADHAWIIGHDGKARRVEPSIRLLAYGVPARVGRLRAYGNAIVPQVAAEVIGAFMDVAA